MQNKYKADFNKVKVLDIVLKKGTMIYIPAYWWYSMKFKELSSIAVFQYRTYMNTVAILPEIFMSILQKQNVKREIVQKLDHSPKKEENKESNIGVFWTTLLELGRESYTMGHLVSSFIFLLRRA